MRWCCCCCYCCCSQLLGRCCTQLIKKGDLTDITTAPPQHHDCGFLDTANTSYPNTPTTSHRAHIAAARWPLIKEELILVLLHQGCPHSCSVRSFNLELGTTLYHTSTSSTWQQPHSGAAASSVQHHGSCSSSSGGEQVAHDLRAPPGAVPGQHAADWTDLSLAPHTAGRLPRRVHGGGRAAVGAAVPKG